MVGYDFSGEAIQASTIKFPEIRFVRHDIYNPIDSKFDVIFCTEVLEHLLSPDVALTNLKTALNAGGILIITVPNGRLDTLNEHINFWSPESWREYLLRFFRAESIHHLSLLGGMVNLAIIK
jgi:2-polyprenyl-3-methyl-5-hydroxy-6-metoxy-1,4-benzoquinol methylase